MMSMLTLAAIPGGFVMAAQLILSLSILVFIHELGHFLAAKYFGMRVDKFYIFFDAYGKKLWSKKIGDTEYGIGWLPLGGYVKIAGMIDESMDNDQLSGEMQDWEFRSKPAWQRFIVMIGGIVMNLLLGWIIYMGLFATYQNEYITTDGLKDGIYAYERGAEYGFRNNDKILTVNGEKLVRFDDVQKEVLFGGTVVVERNGKQISVEVPMDLDDTRRMFGVMHERVFAANVAASEKAIACGFQEKDQILSINGQPVNNFQQFSDIKKNLKDQDIKLGVLRAGQTKQLVCRTDTAGVIGVNLDFDRTQDNGTGTYSLSEIPVIAVKTAYSALASQVSAFGALFTGKLGVNNLNSPIGIAKYFGAVWDWERFWLLSALISLILAFMNILPIPALDGGHMVFLGIEMIIGRPLSDNFLMKAQMVGMAILLPLMAFILGKDAWNIIVSYF